MSNGRTTLAVFFLGAMLAATACTAQQQRPPQPDFPAMAASMNVPEAALRQCMGGPSEHGGRPARPDAAKIASCLKESGHRVSDKAVKDALATGGPKQR